MEFLSLPQAFVKHVLDFLFTYVSPSLRQFQGYMLYTPVTRHTISNRFFISTQFNDSLRPLYFGLLRHTPQT